jgi:acetoin utilization protein AcuB
MIVRDIMTTKLITVEPDDTLAHAASLLRQYQFHHLPVAREISVDNERQHTYGKRQTALLFEGLLTSQDIDLASALAEQDTARPWQERRVVEVMHRAIVRVTPTTTVASAAQILVERGLNYLPVIEFGQAERSEQIFLVGLVTRSDLLMALARAMGAFEPGMQLEITLPLGDVAFLAKALLLASELRMPVRSVMAAPLEGSVPQSATIRLGTINPAPLLLRLQQENIRFSFGSPLVGGNTHVG